MQRSQASGRRRGRYVPGACARVEATVTAPLCRATLTLSEGHTDQPRWSQGPNPAHCCRETDSETPETLALRHPPGLQTQPREKPARSARGAPPAPGAVTRFLASAYTYRWPQNCTPRALTKLPTRAQSAPWHRGPSPRGPASRRWSITQMETNTVTAHVGSRPTGRQKTVQPIRKLEPKRQRNRPCAQHCARGAKVTRPSGKQRLRGACALPPTLRCSDLSKTDPLFLP